MSRSLFCCALNLALLISISISGCGGGGGGSSASSTRQTVSGHVVDGPVKGAVVSLYNSVDWTFIDRCGPHESAPCSSLPTNDEGFFQIDLPSGISPSIISVVAKGGRDTATGVDFTNLPMSAPLSLFEGRLNNVVISPLTTLVSSRLKETYDLPTALFDVANLHPSLSEDLLSMAPAPDSDPHRLSLFLTGLALEVDPGDPVDPYNVVADSLFSDPLFDPLGDIISTNLAPIGIPAAHIDDSVNIYNTLFQADSDVSSAFVREYLFMTLCDTLPVVLSDSSLDQSDPRFIENAHALSDAIMNAVYEGGTTIPIGGAIPSRLINYALWTYPLNSSESFLTTPETFSTLLIRSSDGQPLATDPSFARLASIDTLYASEVPLSAPLPDDNLTRLHYYFNSDASHLYRARTILRLLRDDEISDPVMVKIVRQAGDYTLYNTARTIIDSHIFQSHYRGDAYRQIGESFISHGLFNDALPSLLSAESLYRRVIDSKGIASITGDDIERLQYLTGSYLRSGNTAGAANVLTLLDSALPYLTTTTTFGRLFISTRNVVDSYLDDDQTDIAKPLLDVMYSYALQTPPNVSSSGSYYALKIFFLVETAQRYLDLGYNDRILEIHETIDTIRSADPLTYDKTWYYVTNLVPILYEAGWHNEAFSLAASIPDLYSSYKTKAYKSVAAYEALSSGLPAAIAIIDEHLSTPADKIEGLTYYATNTNLPFVALALIENGQFSAAHEALAMASTLVSSLSATTDRSIYTDKILRGHLKIANLYSMMGDHAAATDEIILAESYLDSISLSTYRIDALNEIAQSYEAAQDHVSAVTILSEATSTAIALMVTLSELDAFITLSDVASTAFDLSENTLALDLTGYCRFVASGVFDPSLIYEGNDHDDLAEDEVDYLIDAAKLYIRGKDFSSAIETLHEASTTADMIWSETVRLKKYIYDYGDDIIETLALAEALDEALDTALSLPYLYDRNRAVGVVAETHALHDDFPTTDAADVDTDHDGVPNFLHPLATPQEITTLGLTLDPDSDNDGIPDISDLRPLYPD